MVGDLPYFLTLGGHGFYWLRLPRLREERLHD
jgi:maltose alpha-D-glucosyltransferase/alpha-amylase